jgi:hypothetical protein
MNEDELIRYIQDRPEDKDARDRFLYLCVRYSRKFCTPQSLEQRSLIPARSIEDIGFGPTYFKWFCDHERERPWEGTLFDKGKAGYPPGGEQLWVMTWGLWHPALTKKQAQNWRKDRKWNWRPRYIGGPHLIREVVNDPALEEWEGSNPEWYDEWDQKRKEGVSDVREADRCGFAYADPTLEEGEIQDRRGDLIFEDPGLENDTIRDRRREDFAFDDPALQGL